VAPPHSTVEAVFPDAQASAATGGTLDVLVVEDDADTREALRLALEDGGLRVRCAGSVGEALAAFGAAPPDVLISDIGMPGEDGYALIRRVRDLDARRTTRTPAIAMTGFASVQDREAALRAGYDAHVSKPIDPEVLLGRVRALARRPVASA
jgi:CheY-like chemotaxis protein